MQREKLLEFYISTAEKQEILGDANMKMSKWADAQANFRRALMQLAELKKLTSRVDEFAESIDRVQSKFDKARKMSIASAPLQGDEVKGKGYTCGDTAKENKANCGEYKFSGEYSFRIAKPNKLVKFDDLIGVDDAKAAITQLLINRLNHREVYKEYGLEVGGMILLYGPPGTGKTSFAKATACEVNLPFVEISCVSLVDARIGATGHNIEVLFSEIRRFVETEGMPLLIFLDEFDYIAKSRMTDDKTAQEAVPALLKELDGFSAGVDNVVIIASTNLEYSLDSAVRSRINRSIELGLPDYESRKLMLEKKLMKQAKLTRFDIDAINMDKIAARTGGMSGRDIQHVVDAFCERLAEERVGLISDLGGSYEQVLLKIINEAKKR